MKGRQRDHRRTWRAPVLAFATAVAVAVPATACGDGPDPVDLIAEFQGRQRLSDHTDQLLGERADDPHAATPEGRASVLAGQIAESVERARELLPDDPRASLEATGGRLASQFVVIGRTLGYTRAALDSIEDDGGDPVDTVAFALRLGWDLADRLDPGDGQLDWVLPGPMSLSATDRDEIAGLLAERSDADAARRTLELVDPFGGAAVIDAIVDELASMVPVTNEHDLVTDLLDSYDVARGTDGT